MELIFGTLGVHRQLHALIEGFFDFRIFIVVLDEKMFGGSEKMLIFHDFAHFGSSAGGPGHQKKKSDVEKPPKNIFSKKSSRNRTRAKYEVLAPSERGERSK